MPPGRMEGVESCGNVGFFWGQKTGKMKGVYLPFQMEILAARNGEALMRLRTCRSRWWHCNVRLMSSGNNCCRWEGCCRCSRGSFWFILSLGIPFLVMKIDKHRLFETNSLPRMPILLLTTVIIV